ncbi:MAG: GTP cyclohydrolase, FolE2/MptA family [Elusimicrobia bacterium]|nr:GTP cyclohydrolase, FolE2/MptA family [Elusimicrobiota bacterium]
MNEEKRFLVDVGMKGLPFPIKVLSKADPEGQRTVALISIDARIMHEFEAGWIDNFIKIVHRHRDNIGTSTLRRNIADYFKELNATTVKATFEYPFFIEKLTPVSKEKCLVKYDCAYVAKVPSIDDKVKVFFRISIPCITTYPASDPADTLGLFGQLSVVDIETEATKDVYPEDLVKLVDKYALSPVYSFLTKEDQQFVIKKIHSEKKSSVVMIDEIKKELAADRGLSSYSIRCSNFGMLHSYSTMIGTEKSWWVPFSGVDDEV